jgi:catechol-2,3-dioxygenase
MDDGSFVAFFEVLAEGDERMFEPRSDFDLHLALEVPDMQTLLAYKEKATAAGVDVRGPADHGFVNSIYLRDPNGYVIELTVKVENYDEVMERDLREAHGILDRWQRTKYASPAQGK